MTLLLTLPNRSVKAYDEKTKIPLHRMKHISYLHSFHAIRNKNSIYWPSYFIKRWRANIMTEQPIHNSLQAASGVHTTSLWCLNMHNYKQPVLSIHAKSSTGLKLVAATSQGSAPQGSSKITVHRLGSTEEEAKYITSICSPYTMNCIN